MKHKLKQNEDKVPNTTREPLKILIVDDEPDAIELVKQYFSDQIDDGEWQFYFSGNGRDALEKIREDGDISVILLDISMPGMSGLEVLDRLNRKYKNTIQTIMVTAFDDIKNVRTAMNGGAFDFITKPIDFTDLEATIKKAKEQVDLIKKANETKTRLNILQIDLKRATELQKELFPPGYSSIEKLEFSAKLKSLREVGGDFYDYFPIDRERVFFTIGDVSDKGFYAAFTMVQCFTHLKHIAAGLKDSGNVEPSECFRRLNELLFSEIPRKVFVAALCGIMDTTNGKLQLCCGGNLPPYILKNDGQLEKLSFKKRLALGIRKNTEFEVKDIYLNKGDKLFMYTDGIIDGITEERNQQRKQFGVGENHLEVFLENAQKEKKSTQEIVDNLMEEVKNFAPVPVEMDDMTVLVLQYK
ncbi:MAG: SpoIIE family protein phosphatase [bacterium]|nr:SpoIIE family protein phosphatase [bacterium]